MPTPPIVHSEMHEHLKEIAKFFSDYANTMLSSGASTIRIERNMRQIAEAWEVKADFSILPTNVIINLWDLEGKHSYNILSPLAHAGINLETVTRLTQLSEDILVQSLELDEARLLFADIIARPRISPWWVLLLASLANASFCRLFGGDWYAIGIVFVATLCGFYVKQRLTAWKLDYRAMTIASATTAATIACSGLVFHWGSTPELALVTSVLYLVPGIPFCNFVSDLIYGHYVCAMGRFAHAMMLTVSLSIGLCIALLMLDIKML